MFETCLTKKVTVYYERDCCITDDLIENGKDRYGDPKYICKHCDSEWQYGLDYIGDQMAEVKRLMKVKN